MDQVYAIADWILNLVLWVGIPLSITSTLIYQYFQTVKADDGKIHGGGGRNQSGEGTVGDYFKQVIKIFIVGLIAWVSIYTVRNILPSAGSAVVGGLGF